LEDRDSPGFWSLLNIQKVRWALVHLLVALPGVPLALLVTVERVATAGTLGDCLAEICFRLATSPAAVRLWSQLCTNCNNQAATITLQPFMRLPICIDGECVLELNTTGLAEAIISNRPVVTVPTWNLACISFTAGHS